MKRHALSLEQIGERDHMVAAACRAAQGKRHRRDVQQFFESLEDRLRLLRQDLLVLRAPKNLYRQFTIYDPKQRVIHAPCFEDRVVHHALIGLMGPVIERCLVPSTYACLQGRGVLVAIQRVQQQIRRFPWYVKVDVRAYFDSIDHTMLLDVLKQRFKGRELFHLLERLIAGYQTAAGTGLPIGALTSQHFANLYLDGFDRFLLESLGVSGHVRYMDDVVWWCASQQQARHSLEEARRWLASQRHLTLKANVQIQRSDQGVSFCGFRVSPGALHLSRRRRRRYGQRLRHWEAAWRRGELNGLQLQQAYGGVFSITAHADSRSWRRKFHQYHGALDV